MKTAEEWFIEQAKRFLGNGLSMNERIALTREIQQDALASIQQSQEAPCKHEWFEGKCVHCEVKAVDFRKAVLDAVFTELPDKQPPTDADVKRIESIVDRHAGQLSLEEGLKTFGSQQNLARHLKLAITEATQSLMEDKWQPIESAPDKAIVASITNSRINWAEYGHRGDGVMRLCWYTPNGKSIPMPTHWTQAPTLRTAIDEARKAK